MDTESIVVNLKRKELNEWKLLMLAETYTSSHGYVLC